VTFRILSYYQQHAMGRKKKGIDYCQSQQEILQLQPRLLILSNVGARRPVAGPTVPVGLSTSTASRCVGVEPMRRCAVTSTRHSWELMRMEKMDGDPSI